MRVPARAAGEFSSLELTSVLTLVRCPFHPVLQQWHVEDPGHSAESAGGRLIIIMMVILKRLSLKALSALENYEGGWGTG